MNMSGISLQYKNSALQLLILLAGLTLAACSKHVMIWKPIDVSRKDQIARAQFSVRSTSDYRFALMFIRSKNPDENEVLDTLLGDLHNDGVPVDLNLRVYRDNALVHDQNIKSVGVYWYKNYEYEKRRLNTAARLIRIMELDPGDYLVEVRTLDDLQPLRNIETQVSFSYYNPKH